MVMIPLLCIVQSAYKTCKDVGCLKPLSWKKYANRPFEMPLKSQNPLVKLPRGLRDPLWVLKVKSPHICQCCFHRSIHRLDQSALMSLFALGLLQRNNFVKPKSQWAKNWVAHPSEHGQKVSHLFINLYSVDIPIFRSCPGC